MYSFVEIEQLMKARDSFKKGWYSSNNTLKTISRNSPELFLAAKEKQGREKKTIEALIKYINKSLKKGKHVN